MNDPIQATSEEVCLVDDDASVLKSMHYLLAPKESKFGRLTKRKNFSSRQHHHVPVVVTDIWMDEVTGLEVLARLCAISPKTRVIVITARKIWLRVPPPWPSGLSPFS